jgi:hypothetical protein
VSNGFSAMREHRVPGMLQLLGIEDDEYSVLSTDPPFFIAAWTLVDGEARSLRTTALTTSVPGDRAVGLLTTLAKSLAPGPLPGSGPKMARAVNHTTGHGVNFELASEQHGDRSPHTRLFCRTQSNHRHRSVDTFLPPH